MRSVPRALTRRPPTGGVGVPADAVRVLQVEHVVGADVARDLSPPGKGLLALTPGPEFDHIQQRSPCPRR